MAQSYVLQVRWPWKGAEREQMVEKRFKEVGMMVTRILDYMPNSVRPFSSLPCFGQAVPLLCSCANWPDWTPRSDKTLRRRRLMRAGAAGAAGAAGHELEHGRYLPSPGRDALTVH